MDTCKEKVERSERKFPFQGLSLLILSLLLVGCVAGLIYLSLNNQHYCQQKQATEDVNVNSDMTVDTPNQKKKERVTYNENAQVAYFRGDDNSFEVQDFSKGLHIIRAPSSGVCYVIPVGTQQNSGRGFDELLKKTGVEGQIQVNSSIDMDFEILPGHITDTSFIPTEAHQECTAGYRWMVVTVSKDTASLEVTKQKREVVCQYCYLVPRYNVVLRELYFYEGCFSITLRETSFCRDLYQEKDRDEYFESQGLRRVSR